MSILRTTVSAIEGRSLAITFVFAMAGFICGLVASVAFSGYALSAYPDFF